MLGLRIAERFGHRSASKARTVRIDGEKRRSEQIVGRDRGKRVSNAVLPASIENWVTYIFSGCFKRIANRAIDGFSNCRGSVDRKTPKDQQISVSVTKGDVVCFNITQSGGR